MTTSRNCDWVIRKGCPIFLYNQPVAGRFGIKMVRDPSVLSKATNWTLEKARKLYCGAGQSPDWEALAVTVRNAHSRKRGFLAAFEQIASGKSQRPPSFAEKAQEQWERLTS